MARGADEAADRCSRRLGDAVLGAARRRDAARASRLFDRRTHGEFRRRADAHRRPLAAGAPHRPRQSRRGIPGEVAGRDRDDPARRLGQSRPRRRRVRPSRPAVGLRPRARPRPHRIDSDRDRSIASSRLRDDGKPALVFAAHLANWELPARRRRTLRASTAPCSTAGPTSRGIADAVVEHARRLHGHADRRPASTRRSRSPTRCERGAHVGMLVDQYYVQRRRR